MKKQDEGLDMLSASVARLGEHAMGISDELGQQNQVSSLDKLKMSEHIIKTDFSLLFISVRFGIRC